MVKKIKPRIYIKGQEPIFKAAPYSKPTQAELDAAAKKEVGRTAIFGRPLKRGPSISTLVPRGPVREQQLPADTTTTAPTAGAPLSSAEEAARAVKPKAPSTFQKFLKARTPRERAADIFSKTGILGVLGEGPLGALTFLGLNKKDRQNITSGLAKAEDIYQEKYAAPMSTAGLATLEAMTVRDSKGVRRGVDPMSTLLMAIGGPDKTSKALDEFKERQEKGLEQGESWWQASLKARNQTEFPRFLLGIMEEVPLLAVPGAGLTKIPVAATKLAKVPVVGRVLATMGTGTKAVRTKEIAEGGLTTADEVVPMPSDSSMRGPGSIKDAIANISVLHNPIIKAIVKMTPLRYINPSVLENSILGKALLAAKRLELNAQEQVKVAMAQLDALSPRHPLFRKFGPRVVGRVGEMPFSITEEGFFVTKGTMEQTIKTSQGVTRIKQSGGVNTKKAWQDVFSATDDQLAEWGIKLTDAETEYIQATRSILRDLTDLRAAKDLQVWPELSINPKTGQSEFYIPRQAISKDGEILKRASDSYKDRVIDTATEGVEEVGMRYATSPRESIALHLRATYKEIIEKDLDNYLAPFSIDPASGVRKATIENLASAIRKFNDAEEALRSARGARTAATSKVERGAMKRSSLKGYKAQVTKLDNQQKRLRRVKDKAQKAYNEELQKIKESKRLPGNLFGLAKDEIPVRLWRKRFFPEEMMEVLEKGVEISGSTLKDQKGFLDNVDPALSALQKVANSVRFLSTVADFAAPITHGLPLLARHPIRWSRATLVHYQAWLDPAVQARYIVDNSNYAAEMARYGVPIGDVEMFKALEEGGGFSLGKILNVVPEGIVSAKGKKKISRVAQIGGKEAFGRFQASYSTFGTMARIELWKAMKPGWQGRNAPLNDLAAYIRNMTGALDARALGARPRQSSIESMFLAFSPRLFRSTIALVTDAVRVFKGGSTVQQKESLKTLRNLVGGVHVLVIAAGLALGKDWDEIADSVNPLKGKKYLAIKIGHDYVGVGGQIRAVTSFITHMTSALARGGKPIEDIISIDLRDNPLIAFWRSRGAVGTSLVGAGLEAATGRNVMPYDDIDSLPDVASFIGLSSLPFAMMGLIEGQSIMNFPFDMLGFRVSRQSAYEDKWAVRQEVADEKAAEWRERGIPESENIYNSPVRTMPQILLDELDKDPRIEEAEVKVRIESKQYNPDLFKYKTETDELYVDFKKEVDALWNEWGGAPSKEFRVRYPAIRANWYANKDKLKEKYAKALEFEKDNEPAANLQDRIRDEYIANVFDNEDLEDPETGEYDYKEHDRQIEILKGKYGELQITAIRDSFRAEMPEGGKQYQGMIDSLKPYLSIMQSVMDDRGLEDEWERYLRTKENDRIQYRKANPVFDRAYKKGLKIKKWVRDNANPQVAKLIAEWGYGKTGHEVPYVGPIER